MYDHETQLYRHFDADGRLLYVGISLSAPHRLSQHMRGSKWAADIVSIKVDRYPSRRDALEAERLAILGEKPLWNVVHNERPSFDPVPKPNAEPAFDAWNVPRNILDTAYRLERLWNRVSSAWGEYPGGLYVGVCFELRTPCLAEELNLEGIFDIGCKSATKSGFRIVTGISAADPSSVVDGGYLNLLTPEGLERCCEEPRRDNGQYDELYESDVVPAIYEYRKACEAAPWNEFLGWTPKAS